MEKYTAFMITWGPIIGFIVMFALERIKNYKNFKYRKSIAKLVEANFDGKVTPQEYDSIVATIKEETFGTETV